MLKHSLRGALMCLCFDAQRMSYLTLEVECLEIKEEHFINVF